MVDISRRSKLMRDLEQDFVPDYDAQNLPSADKPSVDERQRLGLGADVD